MTCPHGCERPQASAAASARPPVRRPRTPTGTIAAMSESLFTRVGADRYRATEASRGPWDPNALHGGPVAVLSAHVAEEALRSSGSPAQHPVRLTLDLERPVPLTPLRVDARVVRPGRKVQVAEVAIFDDTDRRLARATVLALRTAEITLDPDRPQPPDATLPSRPAQATATSTEGAPREMADPTAPPAFHSHATEHRFVRGTFFDTGPSTDWIRLTLPVLPDTPISPLQRVAGACDFMNGISAAVPWEAWTFINPDLTITLHRLPEGEWIGLDAGTRVESTGIGNAEADVFDERGRIGHAVQTLLIDPRPV